MQNNPLVVSLRKPQEEPRPVPPPSPPTPPRRRRNRNGDYLWWIVGALVLIGIATWYWWPFGGEEPDTQIRNERANIEGWSEETRDLVERVGSLIVLPDDEEPTIATVTDPDKLRDQVFFAHAKKGDQVLIYTKARKAYLYDPKANRLLEVAPLTVEAP